MNVFRCPHSIDLVFRFIENKREIGIAFSAKGLFQNKYIFEPFCP